MSLAVPLHLLEDFLAEFLGEDDGNGPVPRVTAKYGIVTAVDPSTATLSIRLNNEPNAESGYRHLNSYSPFVGDYVLVLKNGPDAVAVSCVCEMDEWVVPAFLGAWTNFGGVDDTAAYRRDGMGFVHLKGLIKGGAVGTAAINLPAGNRPGGRQRFVSAGGGAGGGTAAITLVEAGGDVIPFSGGNNTFWSLDGIVFYADQ